MNEDKPVSANNVPTQIPQRQIAHADIARRAEKIWHDRQRPSGNDEAIWLEAESQLQGEAESRPVAGTPSRPYADEPATPIKSRTKVRDSSESAVQTRTATENKPKKQKKEVRSQ